MSEKPYKKDRWILINQLNEVATILHAHYLNLERKESQNITPDIVKIKNYQDNKDYYHLLRYDMELREDDQRMANLLTELLPLVRNLEKTEEETILYKNIFIQKKLYEQSGFISEVVNKLDKYKNYRKVRNYLDNLFLIDFPELTDEYYSQCILLDNRNQIALDAYIFFLDTLNEKLETYYAETPNRIPGDLTHIYRFENETLEETKQFILSWIKGS